MMLVNALAILVLAVAFFLLAAFVFLIPIAFTFHSLITLAIVPVQLYRLARSKRVRQNHSLEHATINLLEQKFGRLHLAGLSSTDGFIIFGSDNVKSVKEAAIEGLKRLQQGESELALHRECGTGRGIVHLVSALLFLFLLLVTGHFSFWFIGLALGVSILLGPLLGRAAQRLFTTSRDLSGLTIQDVNQARPIEQASVFSRLPGVFVKTSR